MVVSNLLYVYGLTCLSILGSLLLAGTAVAPAFTFFEKSNDAEAARRKSLLVASLLWVFLQVVACFLILFINERYIS